MEKKNEVTQNLFKNLYGVSFEKELETIHELLLSDLSNPSVKLKKGDYKKVNDLVTAITGIKFYENNKIEQWYLASCIYLLKLFYVKYFRNYSKVVNDETYELYDKIKSFKTLTNEQKKELELIKTKFERIKNKYIPERKSNEDLIKSYFKIAFKINEIPVLDQLSSDVYSKTSWSRKLKDLNFLVMLDKECDKRLSKKLKEVTKELVIKIKNYIKKQSSKVQISEKNKTGSTNRSNPDYDDTILRSEYDIDNEF